MATHVVTGPDGKKHRVTVPDGKTKEDAIAYIAETKYGIAQDEPEPLLPPRQKRPGKGEGEGLDTQDIIGAGNMLLNGQLAGWGDEFVGGVRTGMDMLNPSNYGEGTQDFSDTYKMYRDDARASQDEFRDENTGTALGLELLGGVASPLNKLKIPGMAMPGTKGPRLQRTLESMGRGTVEGAIAGLGEGRGDLGDQLKSTAWGAGVGGGLSGALTGGAGWAGDQISKRRIAERLMDKAGNFTPIHLIDKAGLGDFYRNTVGRAWGGHRNLADQEIPFVNQATDAVNVAENKAKDAALRTTEEIEGARRNLKRTQADITAETRGANRALSQATSKIEKETAEALAGDATNVNTIMRQESLPDDFRVDYSVDADGALIDMTDGVTANTALDNFWKGDDAFRMVKGREFDWDMGLVDDLRSQFRNDPNFLAEMPDSPELVDKLLTRFGLDFSGGDSGANALKLFDELMSPKVKIDGDSLMELRNFFAKRANNTTNPDRGRAMRFIAKRFDKMIDGQLDDVAKEQYSDQLSRYKNYRTVKDAAKSAKGREPTLAQLRAASAKHGDATTGDSPFFADIDAAEGRVAEVGEAAGLNKSKDAQRKYRLQQRDTAAKNRVARETESKIDRLDKRGSAGRLNAATAEAKEAKRQLQADRVAANPSGASALISTAMLGGWAAPAALLPVLPAGYATARGLSSKGGQLLMAGQKDWQRKLQIALKKGDTAEVTRILARYGAQQASGE